jgi:hypothetical protein
MKRRNLLMIAGLLFFSALAFSQEVYKWVDEKGTAHFTFERTSIRSTHFSFTHGTT